MSSSSACTPDDLLRRGNSFPPFTHAQQHERRSNLQQQSSSSAASRAGLAPHLLGWDAYAEPQREADSVRSSAAVGLERDEDGRWSAARRAFHAAGHAPPYSVEAGHGRSRAAFTPLDERSQSGAFPSLTTLTTALPDARLPQISTWNNHSPFSAQAALPQTAGRDHSHGQASIVTAPQGLHRHAYVHDASFQRTTFTSERLSPLPSSPGPNGGGLRLSPYSDPGFASAWSSQHSSPSSRSTALPAQQRSAPPELVTRPPRSPFAHALPTLGRQGSIHHVPHPSNRQWHPDETYYPAPGAHNPNAPTRYRLSASQGRHTGVARVNHSDRTRRTSVLRPREQGEPSPPSEAQSAKPASLAGPRLRSGLPERTTWAMWVGNVPADTTERELRRFFENRPKLGSESLSAGVESVHLIARSNCAFVNFVSSEHLVHAIEHSHGVPLRSNDKKCKPLVCRLRMREDDAKSGVGAQRGAGLHKTYIRERRASSGIPAPSSPSKPPERSTSPDSDSTTSTTSTFFDEHFPRRYFIMKAHSTRDLESSLRTGLWSTQSHNESVLDQAYRTAREGVFLVFSANKSGSWFGVAKMTGPIHSSSVASPQVDKGMSADAATSSTASGMVSPVELSPTSQSSSLDGGTPFRVQWLSTANVPFSATKHILNSFNANREIKISRDGTEIEPEAGRQLLCEFGLRI
ncbi:hypothetical protein OIV83_003370 [Microbotryomycetes sp. JL201]|nr:hypothetical protein OIV83_003370 [Microbotryomycetes sp. JL201]